MYRSYELGTECRHLIMMKLLFLRLLSGVKEEDAYNYSAIGCVETAVPGKWGYRCTGCSYQNSQEFY